MLTRSGRMATKTLRQVGTQRAIKKNCVSSCLFVFVAIIACCHPVAAQDCKVSAGTKTLYNPQQTLYTKPPAGYLPVFINHVGRHGARHLTKDISSTVAFKLLFKADSIHALTQQGMKLKRMMLLLQKIEAPALKSISQRGRSELKGIAERMVTNNANIFKQPFVDINVEVTKEVRTSQSADAFLSGLPGKIKTSGIGKTIDDTALRFYDLAPAYLEFEKNGNWKDAITKIHSKNTSDREDLRKFPDKFFTDSFILSSEEKEDFCKDIYGFAAIVPSITNEIIQAGNKLYELEFRSLFTCRQLSLLSLMDEAEDFLLKGPGNDTLGVQVSIAVPLLVQFLKTSDEYIKHPTNSVRLRFAHAETISPFASLMQIAPASIPVHNIADFSTSWKAAKVIPLSANIQWIFYKKEGADNLLVRFLLNEKEMSLKGLSTTSFPFYKWDDVRKFYGDLLIKLHVSQSEQMGSYLLNLK